MWLETRDEEIKRNREEGREEKKVEDILGMLEQGFPIEGIAKATKTSIAEVGEIARRNNIQLP